MCFNISGTSKFPAAQTIVRKERTPPVLLRETLAYGTKYGMGVFSLFNTGEEQIGWVPEKDQKLTVGDAFTKVVISLICDVDN